MAHCHTADLSSLLTHQMTGRFKFFKMRRKVKAKYFSLFAESQKDMIFFQLYKVLNISSFCFTSADHLVFVDVQKIYLSGLCADYQGVSFGLIAESGNIGSCIEFLNGNTSNMVEVAILVSFEYCYFSII